MGFWGDVGKWGARIGGYALAPVTGGASIPVGEAIAQGIGNHQAAGKANEQLQQGVGQAEAALSPYANLGANAAGGLNTLMGFGGMPGAGAAAAPTPVATEQPGLLARAPGMVKDAMGRVMDKNRGTLADFAAPQVAQQQTQSSFTRMVSPDGSEEMDVPAEQVQHFLARGARPREARA